MPSGLKRFQKAESLHFITFSCFHRLPLLETPGAWETSSASRPNKVRTGHPISRGNACRLEIGWATRQRANAAQRAYGPEIKKAVKQIEKDRKKENQ
jgi:hypothetical protein